MSQATAMAKSVNYLYYYKVCIPTNTSRSLSSSVQKLSTLNEVQNPNKFPNSISEYGKYDQNPNKLYRDASTGFHRILDHHNSYINASSTYYNNDQKSTVHVARFQIASRSYSGMVKSQMPISYSQPDKKNSDEAGEEKRLLEELHAFCKYNKLKEAVEVLGLLEQHNVSVDVYIYNKILEMYLKCGSIEDAYDLFDEMPQRNLTSWDTIITWLAKNGHGEDAIDMFEEFKSVGLKPDNQMFHGVFAACSVVGDTKEGLLHFESMIKVYNLVPSMDDYASVVDMLGSSGYLNEALEFIEKMPIKPSVEIWEIMMNRSRVHGDLELGDHCAELVNLLDSSRLDEQSKAGLIPIKPSDISRFNPLHIIRTRSHQFRPGDTSHPDHEKILRQLWCLKQPMLEAGYVPQTSVVLWDIDQESKEEALLSHSYILSLSLNLLTSEARSTIRIFNYVRHDANSHDALKVISMLVGRPIVSRDSKRFHHFENGVCSCGDYW